MSIKLHYTAQTFSKINNPGYTDTTLLWLVFNIYYFARCSEIILITDVPFVVVLSNAHHISYTDSAIITEDSRWMWIDRCKRVKS